MATPNMGEVLREESKNSERLRILLLAKGCKDLEELIKKLEAENKK